MPKQSKFAWHGTANHWHCRTKKKWAEMKSVSLRTISARHYPKTGGGKKGKEPWFVDLVLDVLGVDTALIEGIVGKYD